MKTKSNKAIVLAGILFCLSTEISFAQSQYLGNWEGSFMNDFKTIIELSSNENDDFSGSIEMYSGDTQIQNDRLSKITFTKNKITFYIESKQTEFNGEFNDTTKELRGDFIFPDQSKHPITLSRNDSKKMESMNDSKIPYSTLKNKKFTVNELNEDFNFLVEKLEEFHPKLYAYTPKEAFDQLIATSLQNIDSELTLVEYFKRIAPVVESVKCSHTGIRLPQNFQEGLNKYENFLPLKLLFEEKKVYCLNNISSNSEIVPGNEILTINNIPIQNIKEKLYKFISSEGNNTTTKNCCLNQNFNSLFNLIDNSPKFEIEYKNLKSNHTAVLNACNYEEICNNQNRAEIGKPLSFFFDEKKKLGFLTVRSFMSSDINKYIQEMDSIFSALPNAKQLVIDLRGNSGGHPIFAAQLFSYLTNEEFTWFERNELVKDFEPLYNKMQPDKLNFVGDLFVLTDGGCLSTTGHFISQLKYHTNAIFIGEEPGSTFCCNDFSKKFELPNTRIEVNVPTTTFKTAIKTAEKLNPFPMDYIVNIQINDYLEHEDSVKNFALNLTSNP